MDTKKIERLIEEENEHMQKLRRIVEETIREEKLIVDKLTQPETEMLTTGQRISDKVARFGGSWAFIIAFAVVLAIWITYNSVFADHAFDPFPFILMNLVLSCIAALQAPIIMMSQNRQEEKDRLRNENDYMVNLKAEVEIRSLHQKMDLLLEEQIKTLYATQEAQFEMLKELHEKIDQLRPGDRL